MCRITLGFLSLSGMLIKNAIGLIDQINLEVREGKETFLAIVDSAVSRLRPVALAVTMAFGLGFATILTMVVAPMLYAIFLKARAPAATTAPSTV